MNSATGNEHTPPGEVLLDIRDFSLGFRTPRGMLQALRGVSMQVARGRIVGIVGESGCGKSTLISAVIGLLPANAVVSGGQIDFQGRDLAHISPRAMRDLRGDRISMIFQDPMTSLNPVLSIGRQMADVLHRSNASMREKRRRAAEMLSMVGIPDAESRLDAYPHQFSGGMRQRIAIAMALMVKPDLLIADEPTTALDATLEVQIIDLLKDLQQEIGCAILFVSHHLGVVAELCEDVVVMYAGEVAEEGDVRSVFNHPAHPYTRKLLECDPGRIRETTRVLPTIPGEIPDLTRRPPGCIFSNRCPEVKDRCLCERPALHRVNVSHLGACHLLEPGKAA